MRWMASVRHAISHQAHKHREPTSQWTAVTAHADSADARTLKTQEWKTLEPWRDCSENEKPFVLARGIAIVIPSVCYIVVIHD